MDDARDTLARTADIITAFVSKNALSALELPSLILNVHGTLEGISKKGAAVDEPAPQPAVSIKKSLGADYIICLEDGRKFKSLKRHLRTKYDLSPEDYRSKWNLPKDYPMVAPSYAAARSSLAKQMGLGQTGRAAAVAAEPAAKVGRKPRAKT